MFNLSSLFGKAKSSWDADAFIKKYNSMIDNHAEYSKIKALRVNEFNNTVELVSQGYYKNAEGEEVSLSYDGVGKAVFYSEEIKGTNCGAKYSTEIEIANRDCLAVAIDMIEEGYNPAVLNMASRRNPGGGVTSGAGAQEETLFRRTDLFRSLYQYAPYAEQYGIKIANEQYPLDRNFGGIYTPKSAVFRKSEKEGYALMDKPVMMSFISVAGMNRPDLTADNRIANHHIEPIKNKIRTILRIGIRHNHDSLVLGSLGCGAFCNPPLHVAQLFDEVFEEEEFKGAFKKIVFAILDDHNAHKRHNPEGNFMPFVKVFREKVSSIVLSVNDFPLPILSVQNGSFFVCKSPMSHKLWHSVMIDVVDFEKWGNFASITECREFIRRISEKTGFDFDFISKKEWDSAGIKSKGSDDYVHVFEWNRKEMAEGQYPECQSDNLDIPFSLVCSMGNGHDAFRLYLSAQLA